MKSLRVISLGLVFSIVLISTAEVAVQQTAVIEGVVKNASNSQITIAGEPISLDKDGRFRHRFELAKSAYMTLEVDQVLDLFMVPGDSLVIHIDAKRFHESVRIEGRGREVNTFILRESRKAWEVEQYFNRNIRRIAGMEEAAYRSFIDSLATVFSNRLEEFVASASDIDEYFVQSQRAIIRYSTAKVLLDYPYFHRRFVGVAGFLPSGEYYGFLDELDLNNAGLLEFDEYRECLETYVVALGDRLLRTQDPFADKNYKEFRARYHVVMESFTEATVRDELLYFVIHPLVSEYHIKGIDDLLESFRATCTNPDHVSKIDAVVRGDQEIREKCEIRVFKIAGGDSLDAYIYRPEGEPGAKRAGLAFFHGGGWSLGKPEWGHWQCEHFASLGIVSISFEYRLTAQHDVTPVESIADAKSAIRWMREHAGELGIDPTKIVASGFSAGGHLSCCTAMIDKFDEPDEDHSISSAANALMLWVTPVKVFADGWFKEILRGKATVAECDPAQHIRPGLPPSVIFQGTDDDQVPPGSVKEFAKEMTKAGNRCELHMYEGQTHLRWGENADDVLTKMDAFLVSIEFIE